MSIGLAGTATILRKTASNAVIVSRLKHESRVVMRLTHELPWPKNENAPSARHLGRSSEPIKEECLEIRDYRPFHCFVYLATTYSPAS
jgi:hypothetical protein